MQTTEQSKTAGNIKAGAEAQNQQLDKAKTTAVATLDSMLVEDAGLGGENVRQKDMAIPFLALLQSGSPQAKRSAPEYIDGAAEGHILNTVTRELFKEPLEVIHCFFEPVLIEWKDREKDTGGFVAQHKVGAPIEATAKQDPEHRGRLLVANPDTPSIPHLLVPTSQHYVLYKAGSGWAPAVIGMTSSKLTISRRWLSNMNLEKIEVKGQLITPPHWRHIWKLKTVPKKSGEFSWFNFELEKLGPVQDVNTYMQAKGFYEAIMKGQVQVSTPVEDGGEGAGQGASQATSQTTTEERAAASAIL